TPPTTPPTTPPATPPGTPPANPTPAPALKSATILPESLSATIVPAGRSCRSKTDRMARSRASSSNLPEALPESVETGGLPVDTYSRPTDLPARNQARHYGSSFKRTAPLVHRHSDDFCAPTKRAALVFNVDPDRAGARAGMPYDSPS